MEKTTIKAMVKNLRRLNPDTKFRVGKIADLEVIIAVCPDYAQLNFPKGFKFNRKNGELANNRNSFQIMTEIAYNVIQA
ncbi:MAG: hypothetical protein HFJ59_04940 [Clostridia bacterium]|nr:hypothetical protein [Clostridia bacterium]